MGAAAGRAKSGLDTRVELLLHDQVTARQHRELGAFVRYCIARIERDAEVADWWRVKILPARASFRCELIAQYRGVAIESAGEGLDGALSAWEALCKMEQLLRDNLIVPAEKSRGGCGGT
jgi:hypothetical protein